MILIGKKGQLGKILTAFPVVIGIFLLMAVFVVFTLGGKAIIAPRIALSSVPNYVNYSSLSEDNLREVVEVNEIFKDFGDTKFDKQQAINNAISYFEERNKNSFSGKKMCYISLIGPDVPNREILQNRLSSRNPSFDVFVFGFVENGMWFSDTGYPLGVLRYYDRGLIGAYPIFTEAGKLYLFYYEGECLGGENE